MPYESARLEDGGRNGSTQWPHGCRKQDVAELLSLYAEEMLVKARIEDARKPWEVKTRGSDEI